jgi:hypothetical protein
MPTALLEEQGRGGVAGIVDARLPNPGCRQKRAPVRPVGPGVDGRADHSTEDKITVFPGASRSETISGLLTAVCP